MASTTHHAATCPQCNGDLFKEEKIVKLDPSVVIRLDLPVPARTVQVSYRYVCINCQHVLDQPWTGHHDS